MYDVITVGSATIDVFAYTDKSELISVKSKTTEEDFIAYPSGSKLLIKTLKFYTGGGGTNTAVAFARLGFKTGYLGAVGKDENGKIILNNLKKEKIDFLGATIDYSTDYSIILDSIAHDRTILNYKGASSRLDFKKLNLKKLKCKWFYFSSLVDDSYKTLEKLSAYAKRSKIKVAFNPSSYLAVKGKRFLKKLLSNTCLLVLNDEEAGKLTCSSKFHTMFHELKKLGPKMICITCGNKGVYALVENNYYFAEAHKVRVKEATGAGDSFASSFLAGWMLKKDAHFALRMGMANAESNLEHYGAKEKLLTRKEILKRMNTNITKIKKIDIEKI
jgi:ribokinase